MAVWIALAAVFIALIPVFVVASRQRAGNKNDSSGDGARQLILVSMPPIAEAMPAEGAINA